MSTTFISIDCSSCSFGGSSLVLVGDYRWVHQGKSCQILRQMGVCSHCNDLVAMENLPDKRTVLKARELHPELCGTHFPFTLENPVEKDEAKRLARNRGFPVLEVITNLGRKPVCLTCGGENVRPIKLPNGFSAVSKVPVFLGFGHAGCGGTLIAKGSNGTRVGVTASLRCYDIQGRYILDEAGNSL